MRNVEPCEAAAVSEATEAVSSEVTDAPRGPWPSQRSIRSTSCSAPEISVSTEPSSRLRTQPCTPRRAASARAENRKPTPCTRPCTTTRSADTARNQRAGALSGARRGEWCPRDAARARERAERPGEARAASARTGQKLRERATTFLGSWPHTTSAAWGMPEKQPPARCAFSACSAWATAPRARSEPASR